MREMSETQKVRVRFAPSPTGPLHIGGVRTALYNYLFARHYNGEMLLRIEDTDRSRFVPGAEDYILQSLDWLGIEIDEGVGEGGSFGPYHQSKRREIYRVYVRQLLESGKAYKAYDTPEELEAKRKEVENFQYDATTRMGMKNSLALSPEECKALEDEGCPYVVRFKVEPGEDITFTDLVRGEVTINSSILDDKVLYKKVDDLPTYHLANIVDDHLMQITHVIRGEEWLPSTPLHVLLYRALGWEESMPLFAHLPLLLKPEGGGKLSKRDGDRLGFPVFPLEWRAEDGSISSGYRESGYLPEAVINFLALLGWHPGDDRELLTMEEMIAAFSLERVNKSGAHFDYEKGRWFNHKYIQEASADRLAKLALPYFEAVGIKGLAQERVAEAIGLVRDRIYLLPEIVEQTSFLFVAPMEYDAKTVQKRWKDDTPQQLEAFIDVMEEYPEQSKLEEMIPLWIKEKEYNMGGVMNAIRLALVGKPMGPHLHEIIGFIGIPEAKRRILRAINEIHLKSKG